MHFAYRFCDGNANAAVEEYRRRYPERRIPSRGVFTRVHQTLRDSGCLPSVAMQSEREMVRTMNTQENILEIMQRSPHLSTRRMASCIGVSMQVWRTGRFISLPQSKGTTSGTRRPCSTYGIVPLGKSTSGTVKGNFIH